MDKKIKVLMVDDESDFIQPMAFWLESKNYDVVTAGNGEEALQVFTAEKPDIVLLDLNMPVLDGLGALKKIREIDKDVPVIIISAYVEDARIKECNQYGISGVFYKCKTLDEGLTLLEVALRTHKQLKK